MSRTSVESDDGVLSRDQVNSPMSDRGKHGGNSDGVVLKKGPWTSAEDAILVEYVKKHNEGNWNAVQKYSGLSRCGKSCRLRWANHLRPNLKKGAFSAEEERIIVELHAKMGNKWARMAAHLPGRTDNEIKNYWNTRIKRRQRAGLPLYPAELCMQSMQDSPQGSSYHGMNFGNKGGDILQSSTYQIPDVVFDGLKSSPSILPYVPEISDVSASNFMMNTLVSSQYGSLLPPSMHPTKRLRESTSLYPGFSAYSKDGFSPFHQYEDDTCEKIVRSFAYPFPVDDPTDKIPLSFGGVHGSHSLSNGNSSTSKPNEALKMELPSLQYPEPDLGSWDTSSHSPPSLVESVDKFFQSPPRTGKVEESDFPPYNNGLLESLVYEAKTLSSAKNPSPDKSSTSSTALTPCGGDISSSTTLNVCKSEWEEYGDPISPSGHSATSIFDEHTSVNPTLDEQQPVLNVKEEPIHQIPTPERDEVHCGDLSCPDAFLVSPDCFGLNSVAAFKDQQAAAAAAAAAMTDPLESILGDLSSDYRPTSTTNDAYMDYQGWGFYAWNNMPSVCQMSELQ